MSDRIGVKTGDVGSKVTATLMDDAGAVNLTGATVKFIMRAPSATAPKVNAAATIDNATAGKVSYAWAAADIDTPGTYYAEWQVTFAGGAVQTFPSDRYLIVDVLDDLD